MFVSMLELEQRRLLLEAASYLAELDGLRPEAERELLETLNVEAGLPDLPEPVVEPASLLEKLSGAFSDAPSQRNVLLLELAGVCMADGQASPEELRWLASV